MKSEPPEVKNVETLSCFLQIGEFFAILVFTWGKLELEGFFSRARKLITDILTSDGIVRFLWQVPWGQAITPQQRQQRQEHQQRQHQQHQQQQQPLQLKVGQEKFFLLVAQVQLWCLYRTEHFSNAHFLPICNYSQIIVIAINLTSPHHQISLVPLVERILELFKMGYRTLPLNNFYILCGMNAMNC